MILIYGGAGEHEEERFWRAPITPVPGNVKLFAG